MGEGIISGVQLQRQERILKRQKDKTEMFLVVVEQKKEAEVFFLGW